MSRVVTSSGDQLSSVRLPQSLAEYACERSLLCCRPPWRVWVTADDFKRIDGLLRADDAGPAFSKDIKGLCQDLGAGGLLMGQTEERCVALDEQPPACRLQTAGGIEGLPVQCRNFPRSVVETPAGAEVAFLLDCPTVAGVIVDKPKPFKWMSKDRADWGFPSVRDAQPHYWWSSDQSISFDALDELRAAWWARLDPERAESTATKSNDKETGQWLLGVLAGMASSPDDPQSNGERARDRLVEDLGFQEAAVAMAFVAQLPARGARYTTKRDELFEALQLPCDLDALVVAADERLATFAFAAGLMLQHAGVHDGMPASDGIRAAAQQVALALSLSLALKVGGEVSLRESLQDALTLSSHLYRYRRYSQMVFVD